MRLGGIAVFAVALAACGLWVGVSADSPPSSSSMAIAYTATPQYAAAAWLQGGERFPAGARIMLRDGGVDRLLGKLRLQEEKRNGLPPVMATASGPSTSQEPSWHMRATATIAICLRPRGSRAELSPS